jgi:hypothetical protein
MISHSRQKNFKLNFSAFCLMPVKEFQQLHQHVDLGLPYNIINYQKQILYVMNSAAFKFCEEA